jgi:hypothetical protein
MTKIKNQHFVPQFYLRFFSRNGISLSVFDKVARKDFISAIDSIGCDKYFYDHENLNSYFGYQFIVNTFSKYESDIAPILKALISELEGRTFHSLASVQRPDIGLQIIRTKENRLAQHQVFELLKSEMTKRGATNEFLENYSLLDEFNEKEEHLKKILDTSQTEGIIQDICERIWIFVRTESKYDFVTSDSPVVKHTQRDRSYHAFEIFIPLTTQYGLMILVRKEFKDLSNFENKVMPIANSEGIKFYNHYKSFFLRRETFDSR